MGRPLVGGSGGGPDNRIIIIFICCDHPGGLRPLIVDRQGGSILVVVKKGFVGRRLVAGFVEGPDDRIIIIFICCGRVASAWEGCDRNLLSARQGNYLLL